MTSRDYSFSPPTEPNTATYRRQSYANVTAGINTPTQQESDLNAMSSAGTGEQESVPSTAGHSRHHSRAMDIDDREAQRKNIKDKETRDPYATKTYVDDHLPFFTPSYLRHSRHVQRLHRAYEERLTQAREEALLHPHKEPSLSTSSSNVNLSKMHASHIHRPAVQDVIERLPLATADDQSHPLPSRWSEEDKMNGLDILADGTEIRFVGVTKTSDEAASTRTDHPMPKECGLYYFEVTILSKHKDGLIGIGFSSKKANLNRLPGWENDSWAYHGDDGYSFACTASGKSYGPKFSSNDTIGCGVNFRTGTAFFTKNGVYLGEAFKGIKTDRLFPSVGIKKPGEHLRVNFGRTPFIFDIDRLMAHERQVIMRQIGEFDVSKLHPPDDENTLIHKLVGQYLAHEGYVETAQAFAQDLHDQRQSLAANTQSSSLPKSEDDIHAIKRQKIRKSILDGDIDKALKYASTYYPNTLEEDVNKDVYFRLKCRKFIEMIRRLSEFNTATSSPTALTKSIDSLASNGFESDAQMELDDQLQREASTSAELLPADDVDMDISQELPPKSSFMKETKLLDDVLAYGRKLKHEFGSDPRQHVKKQLDDTLAIIAYPNPSESPLASMLDPQGRVQIAEEINRAILVSLGKPASAALEKMCAQTQVLLDETARKTGNASAFVNVSNDFLRP
ncbi:Hypothetical protein R9X50_00771900 [Acrodontium crateriforme]|uniref:Protein SSH4 n=1 Tax=Acrodontium crateriforme TaxID=150365 RepID=A0AAQ3MBV7_9PEZI|nr:Hypothetical protein R9X50_00771900 [Acrodontium crateriforme]